MNATTSTLTIELGSNESIAITKNGVVIGFVTVKRQSNNSVELLGQAVNFDSWNAPMESWTHNSFACGMSIKATVEEMSSADQFISAINENVAGN